MQKLAELQRALEHLEKPQLVALVLKLAAGTDKNYAVIASAVSAAGHANETVAWRGMKAALKSALKQTDKRAEEACGEQHHLYDNSNCIYDVERVFNAWVKDSDNFSPGMTLEALCYLADRLEPNLNGRISAFDGDRVLKILDLHATSTLAQTTDDKLPDKILEHVMEVFAPDYTLWTNMQSHGLLLNAPATLESGKLASARLQRRGKPTPNRRPPPRPSAGKGTGPKQSPATVGNFNPTVFVAPASSGRDAGTIVQVGGHPPPQFRAQNPFQMTAIDFGTLDLGVMLPQSLTPAGPIFEHLPSSRVQPPQPPCNCQAHPGL
jgi:hypothetical protein